MYTGPDQSWRRLDRFLSEELFQEALTDALAYGQHRGLSSIALILHGGEPSLYPPARLERLIDAANDQASKHGVRLNWSVQTNAVAISEESITAWLSREVAIGVSLDLSHESNDSFRVDKKGMGTYSRALEGIRSFRIASEGREPQSMLSVIDHRVAPERAMERLQELAVPYVDLLLPDETWDTAAPEELRAKFAPWLVEMWDAYWSSERTFQIRWFLTIAKLLAGGVWGSDSLGLRAAGVVIVDTDGSYHFHDALRLAGKDVNDCGFTAGEGGLDEIERMPVMQMMMDKRFHLPQECSSCDVLEVCGGGHIVHRYSTAKGLSNRSVYCGALQQFYRHAKGQVREGSSG